MTPEIYNGIGKKLRASYLAGKSTADEVLCVYRKNKKRLMRLILLDCLL